MINGYSAEQVRAAERPHLEAGEPLMRLAATGLAAEIRKVLGSDAATAQGRAPRILLLIGSGDNGGDGLFAGAELADDGFDVTIVATTERMHEAGLAAALAAGASLEPRARRAADRLTHIAAGADVVVDAIVGTGTSANPALRGEAREIVAAVLLATRASDGPVVVAVDVPSGINPDDGTVPDPLVLPADVTVTFGGYKAGLLLAPASRLAGSVRLIDIGLGPDLDRVEPLVRLPR